MIGDYVSGPWIEIANGSFPDPRQTRYNVPLTNITLSGYIPDGQVSNMNKIYMEFNTIF